MLIINWVPDVLFIGKLGQQLKGLNSSVTVFLVMLKGQCCDIILNVHAPSEDKDNDIKYSFCIERLFDQLPVYHMKMLLDKMLKRREGCDT